MVQQLPRRPIVNRPKLGPKPPTLVRRISRAGACIGKGVSVQSTRLVIGFPSMLHLYSAQTHWDASFPRVLGLYIRRHHVTVVHQITMQK